MDLCCLSQRPGRKSLFSEQLFSEEHSRSHKALISLGMVFHQVEARARKALIKAKQLSFGLGITSRCWYDEYKQACRQHSYFNIDKLWSYYPDNKPVGQVFLKYHPFYPIPFPPLPCLNSTSSCSTFAF